MNSKPVVHGETRGTRKTARNPVIYRTSNKGSFRVQKNAASLKPGRKRQSSAFDIAFPRSKERGFIEAREQPSLLIWTSFFPRSKERGFIEARIAKGRAKRRRSFRVQKNAASLKLGFSFAVQALGHRFPRSKERGFIEAAPAV